jgi:hypothetical protein
MLPRPHELWFQYLGIPRVMWNPRLLPVFVCMEQPPAFGGLGRVPRTD